MLPLLILLATPPQADPELEGMPSMPADFGPAPATVAAEPVAPSGPSEVRFGGAFTARADQDLADDGYGEDVFESRLRLDLELAARLDPNTTALVSGRLTHEARTPDAGFDGARAGHEIELREARVSWQWGALGLDVGNLYLRWGVADAVSPNDVLNPQDFRDPAPVEFEVPLVPIPAARLTAAAPGDLSFELDFIPFFEPHRAALFGTDWAPVGGDPALAAMTGSLDLFFSEAAQEDIQPVLTAPQPPEESPYDFSVGTRVGWRGPGLDLHLNATHGWDRIPSLTFERGVAAFLDAARRDDTPELLRLYPEVQPVLASGDPLLRSRYHRLNLLGGDAAWALGDFLLKAEAAYSFARTLYTEDFEPKRTASLSWAGGFDWLPDPDFTVTLEAFGLRPSEDGEYLYLGRHYVTLTGHLRWAAVPDTLTLELTGQYGLTQEDHTLAPSVRWQPAEGHALSAGAYLLDGPADSIGGLYARNDAGWLRYALSF